MRAVAASRGPPSPLRACRRAGKPAIDRMRPGSLNPRAAAAAQKSERAVDAGQKLFARKSKPLRGPPRSIGYYSAGCPAGAVALPMTGPDWQVMRPSRLREGQSATRSLRRTARQEREKGRLERSFGRGHVAAARRTDDLDAHHQIGLDVDIWFKPMPNHVQKPGGT